MYDSPRRMHVRVRCVWTHTQKSSFHRDLFILFSCSNVCNRKYLKITTGTSLDQNKTHRIYHQKNWNNLPTCTKATKAHSKQKKEANPLHILVTSNNPDANSNSNKSKRAISFVSFHLPWSSPWDVFQPGRAQLRGQPVVPPVVSCLQQSTTAAPLDQDWLQTAPADGRWRRTVANHFRPFLREPGYHARVKKGRLAVARWFLLSHDIFGYSHGAIRENKQKWIKKERTWVGREAIPITL